MKKRNCDECKNFVQHYVKSNLRYKKINYGHCHHTRKTCNLDKVCKGFVEIDQTVNKKENELNEISTFLSRIAKDIESLRIVYTDTDEDPSNDEKSLLIKSVHPSPPYSPTKNPHK